VRQVLGDISLGDLLGPIRGDGGFFQVREKLAHVGGIGQLGGCSQVAADEIAVKPGERWPASSGASAHPPAS
jgi:hypothetical protein